ncbi:MAG: ECF-type sigma factor [Pseudomonadota bacterium]
MSDLTELLQHWGETGSDAQQQVFREIYGELRRIAARHLASERAQPLVQPTMLVHEAYLKLSQLNRIEWQDRGHFFAMAARAMREFLVDEARRRRAAKRDGGIQVTMVEDAHASDAPKTDMLALNDALDHLAAVDPERAVLVELRFFGGLSVDEIATLTGKSSATIKRNWQISRAWLYQKMNEEG